MSRKFQFPVRAISVTLALFAMATCPSVSSAEETFHGQVVTTAAGELSLSVAGDVMRFSVAEDAMITIDGQIAVFADITPDHLAQVTADRAGDGWKAMSIEAHSQRVVVESSNFVIDR